MTAQSLLSHQNKNSGRASGMARDFFSLVLVLLLVVFGTSADACTISISASSTSICAGSSITLTGTIGSASHMTTYQWKKNGVAMTGTGNSGSIASPGNGSFTFTTNSLSNGDVITCYITEPSASFSTTSAGITITVYTVPAITGSTTVGVAGSTALSDATSGGNWSSSNTSVAIVCATCGIVTGVSAGTSAISYNTTGCGVGTIVRVIPVLPVSGPTAVCVGSMISLSDATTGGTWSSNNTAVATVGSATGIVTGITAGYTILSYTAYGATMTSTIFVNPVPTAITGGTLVGIGGAITLGDALSGGTWSSSHTAVAVIGSVSGVVSGISSGSSVITYNVSGCTTTSAISVVPVAAISGAASVCTGSTITLSDATSGGTWTSSNTSVATVGSSSGVVAGVAAGMAIIAYHVAGYIVTSSITVNTLPTLLSITGITSVSAGSTITLRDVTTGATDTWSSSNTSRATVDSTGVVTGVSNGTAVITYAVTTGCGTVWTTVVVSVTGLSGTCTPVINTFAGAGTSGYSGDGGPATAAKLSDPYGVAADGSGNIYIADKGNHCIRKVNASGMMSTLAGTGTAGYSGDNGAATAAKLHSPTGVACDADGNVYIADQYNNCIRKVSASGTITTFAGTGTAGYSGDGGAATAAKMNQPVNVATDHSGNVFIVDFYNSAIRKVSTSGIIITVAGNGTPGFSGDGGAATAAKLYLPTMMACDLAGNLYIDDENNDRIRKVSTTGIITTFAGNGTDGYWGDGGAATAAELNETWGVCTDLCGNVYIADEVNERIRMVNAAGIITTYCGTGTRGHEGDGGPATAANLYNPYGICSDAAGNIYIADNIDQCIRKITACSSCTSMITGNSVVCSGGTDTLKDAAMGGTWSSSNTAVATVNPVSGVVTGVSAGSVFITYATSSTAVVTMTVLPSPSVTGVVTNATCSGYSNGNIVTTVTGGTTTGSWLYYTYQWSTGATTNGAWGLAAGTYSVTATDPDGCSGTSVFTVAQPTRVTSSAIMRDTLIGCGRGMLDLTVSGGTGPYTYSWDNGATTQDILGLTEGAYVVTITDSNNCQGIGWYYVNYCLECSEDGERRSSFEAVASVSSNNISVKAYPNPFSSRTNITFSSPVDGQTTVEIYNAINSEKLETIFNEYTNSGTEHACVLNGENLAAGMYLYKISTGNSTYTGKVVLVK